MAKDPKVCFQFLVDTFRFTISLRVVSGGEGEVVLKESGEFPSEGRCELRAAIRDKFVVEAESSEDFGEKEFSNPGGVYRFVTRDVNYPLTEPMVDHDHYRIKILGWRKTGDKIHGDLLKWAGGGGSEGS